MATLPGANCRLTSLSGRWSQQTFHRTTGRLTAFSMLVTNVPGSFKTYSVGGAALAEIYPMAPLFDRQQANVAVIRQQGMLRIGVVASWPDPNRAEAFVAEVARGFAEIAASAASHAPSAPVRAVVE